MKQWWRVLLLLLACLLGGSSPTWADVWHFNTSTEHVIRNHPALANPFMGFVVMYYDKTYGDNGFFTNQKPTSWASKIPSSAPDGPALFINGECRGLTEVRNTADDGGYYFLLKIHGNNADLRAPLTLSYYSAQLKQLFTLPAIDAFVPERTRGFDKDFVPALLDGCAKYPVHCQLTVTLQPSASFTVAPDDLVAAFVGDECRGVGQVGTPFTVFAHDDNEVLQLRYYSATKGGIYTFARTITAAQQQLSYPMNL